MASGAGRVLKAVALVLALAVVATLGYFGIILLEKREYRLEYPAEVVRFAAEYGVDRYLVAAIIHCESGNRPTAESPKGALGLMQIMPATGEWIAGKLEWQGYSTQTLLEPEANIELGCWYLGYLSEKYQGNMLHILAAYNAGPGNLDSWLQSAEYSTNGVLQNIPFKQTDEYVDRVQRAYEKYQKLYKNQLG